MAVTGEIPEITILGTDYPTTDGTCVRDYVHVEDLASAHLLALRHLLDGGATRVFNLGTGSGNSVREVVDCVARITGRDVPVQEGPRREGDPAVLVACADRIQSELGWKPRHTDLDAIVRSAWNWKEKGGRYSVVAGENSSMK